MVKFILGGIVGSILLALACTAWSYFLICLGLHPESTEVAAVWAPLLALFCIGAFAGAKSRAKHRWLVGLFPAAAMVLLWFAMWGYLVGRFSLADWGHSAFGGLSAYHLREWGLALLSGIAGSAFGTWVAGKVAARASGWASIGVALAILTGAQAFSSWNWNRETGSTGNMTMTVGKPDPDGTVVRHFTFDFATNPNLRLRLYDADSDDRIILTIPILHTWDRASTSWERNSTGRHAPRERSFFALLTPASSVHGIIESPFTKLQW